MAIQVSTQACDDIFLVRVDGTVTPNDLTALALNIPTRGLVDLRASEFSLPQDCLMDLALRVAPIRKALQWAIVAASDFQYASARQFASFVESRSHLDSQVQLHVSRDLDRGFAWLASLASLATAESDVA